MKRIENGYIDLSAFECVPVYPSEPWVFKDILWSTNHVAQSLGAVGIKESLDDVAREAIHASGPVDMPIEDLLVDSI